MRSRANLTRSIKMLGSFRVPGPNFLTTPPNAKEYENQDDGQGPPFFCKKDLLTHMLHGTGIFTYIHLAKIYGFHVGKYSSPMENLG